MTPAGNSPGDRLRPGAVVAGYRLEERIGKGGMAVVFRATDEHLGRPVALKILAPGFTTDNAFRMRFINESRAAAAVEHPHIIPIYEAGESAGLLFIAMRYVPGGDAKSLVRQAGPLSADRAWRIISQVAAALDAAHARRLVHRDVKPANMLLDRSAGMPGADRSDHVYLTDFGISKQAQSAALTVVGQILGTLEYAAPEQIDGSAVDGRTDQYSLACSTFELLAGAPPFRRGVGPALIYAQLAQAPPALTASRPDLQSPVDRVLAKAMAKAAGDRYATCSQYVTDLGRALRLVAGQVEAVGQGMMPPVPETVLRASRKPRPPTEIANPPARPLTPPAAPIRPPGIEPPTRRRET
jgi:serine/threonine protein kinase